MKRPTTYAALEQLKQLCDALENPASYRKEYAMSFLSRFREELPEIYKALSLDQVRS